MSSAVAVRWKTRLRWWREDRDGVGLELWRMVVTIREHTPGAKAQIGSGWGRPKLKPWLT